MSDPAATITLTHQDVTTSEVVAVRQTPRERLAVAIALAVCALLCLVFGLLHGPRPDALFRLAEPDAAIGLGTLTLSQAVIGVVSAIVCAVLAGYHQAAGFSAGWRRTALAVGFLLLALVFLGWATTSRGGGVIDVPGLFGNSVFLGVPLILGAMAGVLSERSGVINVAIEGQMLAGAFAAAIVATVAGSLGAGVLGSVVVGALVGMLLAVFAIRYQVNQVVLGVVINLLVLGLTTYLYTSVLQRNTQGFNSPGFLDRVRIPVLADIPILGPAVFNDTLLVYATIVVVVALHFALFHTRWGLRTRAVGEHPRAADTVGLDVNRRRFWNVVLGGAIAGLAGAAVSIGSTGAFQGNMTAGKGFIALAAVIFGRWTPLGSAGAALLFAFTTALQTTLSIITTPVSIPQEFLGMLPYLATIVIVAGVIGQVRPPAADGVPYVKS